MKKFKDKQILKAWKLIIDGLGLDLKDENLRETPERMLKSYYEIFQGISADDKIKEFFKKSFPSTYKGIVTVQNIKCFSMCPHHFLPVEYTVHIGYISEKGKMLGISKLARVAELLARKPELQETFTEDIAKTLMKELRAEGAIAVVYGQHMCMRMRGIQKPESVTITSSVLGRFKTNHDTRKEFYDIINK